MVHHLLDNGISNRLNFNNFTLKNICSGLEELVYLPHICAADSFAS